MLLHPPGVEAEIFVKAEDQGRDKEAEIEARRPQSTSDELQDSTEGASDLLSDLQPTLSRESAYSTSKRSHSRGRSWSNVASSSVARIPGVSLFRTRSLPEDHPTPPSPSLLWRLTRSRKESTEGPSSPARPETIQESIQAPTPPAPTPAKPSSSSTVTNKGPTRPSSSPYPSLQHPLPATEFKNYPNFTPGGADSRWRGSGEMEEGGLVWAGPIL